MADFVDFTDNSIQLFNKYFILPVLSLNASVTNLDSNVTTFTNLSSVLANASSIKILNASVLANTSTIININYPNPNFSNVSIGSGSLFTNSIQSLASSANVSIFTNTTGNINFGPNTANINIGSSGSNVSLTVFGRITAAIFNSTSDYRLKENIDYNVSLDITRLKPCYYNFINNSEQKIGFIAHEVQEIIPEAVIGIKDCVDHDLIVPQRIDYNIITAASIHTIQNLMKHVTKLENRIETIESNYSNILKVIDHLMKENNDLKTSISAIQSRMDEI
jgi:FtsZ-binding cell division protein ZapB